jgi:hypothetical protein
VASLPTSFAAANSLGSAGGIGGRVPTQAGKYVVAATDANTVAAQQKRKAAALKKKKLQQQQAAAANAKKAKALQAQQKKKEWYADDRDRGLDVAAEYAPKQIGTVRKNNYIAKGDTVSTGSGKKGWQKYVDKYYSR